MSAKWKNLGQQLGLEDGDLDYIGTMYSDPADCMRNLISIWLQDDHLYTWNHIIIALRSPTIGKSQLADGLKEKYLPGELFDMFAISSTNAQGQK